MKLPILAAAAFAAASFGAYTFAPNENTGMIKISVNGNDLSNVVKAYENTGFHDFGLSEKILDVPQITNIKSFYLHDFTMTLNEPYVNFKMKGSLKADAKETLGPLTFRADVRTKGINAKASAFFGQMGVSDDNNVHLNVCLSEIDADVDNIHYGYGAFIDAIVIDGWLDIDGQANSKVDDRIKQFRAEKEKSQKCMDLSDFLTISYPTFLGDLGVSKAGTKVEDGKIVAYGCPVAKSKLGNQTVVSMQPCETASYTVGVFTSPIVGDAGTKSNTSFKLCGNTVVGKYECISKTLPSGTGKGQNSYFTLETTKVFTDNLSMTLTSDNTGSSPGWYVDSVVVDMGLPNNKGFHYWFPVSRWIGGSSPTSYTLDQKDNWQVYTFDVETGDRNQFEHSGTDADIVAVACDVDGKCLGFFLDTPNHGDFEGGNVNHFEIVSTEVLGPIASLTIHNLYNSGEHKGWYVQDVAYRHYSSSKSIDHSTFIDGQTFMFRQWLAKGETKGNYYTEYVCNLPIVCGVPTGNLKSLNTVNAGPVAVLMDISATRYVKDNFGYGIVITTKNEGAAGTDADIVMTIEGCNGETEVFNLNDDLNNFEKGDTDRFRLTGIKDLKGIKSVKLVNDKSGKGAGWCPSAMSVDVQRFNSVLMGLEVTSNESVTFDSCFNSTDGWERKFENTNACQDAIPPVLYSYIYNVRAGEYLSMLGANLSGHKVTLNLNRAVDASYVSERSAKFLIPNDVPVGLYELGSVQIDGVNQQVFINVVGPQPILDGISVTVVEPGDAFEISLRNFSAKALFFLDSYPLARIAKSAASGVQSANSVILQVPANVPNGRYKLRVVDNGWDITSDETIEVYKLNVPHVKSLSSAVVYTGDALTIMGENFGTAIGDISVKIGTVETSVVVVTDNKIVVTVPQNFSGKDLPITVKRVDQVAPEKLVVEVIDLVPHVSSISAKAAYTGEVVSISGKNFGTAVKDIEVSIGGVVVEVKSVSDGKITIVIPQELSGNDLPVVVSRNGYEAPEALTITVKSIPLFLSFDDPEKPWTSDDANVSYDDVIKQGDDGYSLQINGEGYKTVKSPVFNTVELGALSNKVQLDVWIPAEQVNEYWKGEVQLVVDLPAAGLHNAWVGQAMLTDLPAGWNTVEFTLNEDIYKALSSDYPNARFIIVLNANQNTEDFRIDNFRFAGDVKVRETEHVVAYNPKDIYAADFMSFDNINDWSVSSGDLLFVAEPSMEGLGATGVNASGYVVVTSRNFDPSEIDFATSTISVDVYVPNPQPNDYWVGELSMTLSCPENGIQSLYLGGQDLTHMFREEFNNVQFTVPAQALAALRYGVGECNISVNLNVNNGSGLFLLDNMGFVKAIEIARAW